MLSCTKPICGLLILTALSGPAWCQPPGNGQSQAGPFTAIQSTDRQVRSALTSVNTYSTNKAELSSVRTDPGTAGTSADARKELEFELDRLNSAISSIDQFKKDLKNLEVQVSLINNGINSLRIVSPTSNFLGESFADILLRNAIEILGSDVGNSQRTRFQKVLSLIVTNPVMSSVMKSNPITSLAREAVAQAVTISDGKIQRSTIDKFNNSITPYLDFYGSIDAAADELQQTLVAISLAINKKQSKMRRLETSIQEVLNNYSGRNTREKLKSMLQVNKQPAMSAQQVRDVMSVPDARVLNQLIERQLFVVDDFVDDPVALQGAYNNYIEKMKSILNNARNAKGLNFDGNKIQEAIREYKPI